MKKTYSKPSTEVIKLETAKILCGSNVDRWPGPFGQVPGLSQTDGELLA